MKAAKYTGQMVLEDTSAETKVSNGDAPVLVATEYFELGVDNPKVKVLQEILEYYCKYLVGLGGKQEQLQKEMSTSMNIMMIRDWVHGYNLLLIPILMMMLMRLSN